MYTLTGVCTKSEIFLRLLSKVSKCTVSVRVFVSVARVGIRLCAAGNDDAGAGFTHEKHIFVVVYHPVPTTFTTTTAGNPVTTAAPAAIDASDIAIY